MSVLAVDDVEIYNCNGEELGEDELIGTGSKLVIRDKDGEILDEVVVVVLGDLDGDGKVSSTDALRALKQSSGILDLDECFVMAGDLDGGEKVTSTEALRILKYSVGVISSLK